MAANDPYQHSNRQVQAAFDGSPREVMRGRLEEEINRAERHGTRLSCLLLVIHELDELAREHGSALSEQTVAYVADALQRELRRFDRVGPIPALGESPDGELLVILPGADSPRGEIVARRVLRRLRTIKLETDGALHPLRVSVGLASWHGDLDADGVLARARSAMRSVNGENGNGGTSQAAPVRVEPDSEGHATGEPESVLGRWRGH